jgi:tetracycline resistance efflux pump
VQTLILKIKWDGFMDHYGFVSLLPSFVAIVLAIMTRQVFLSLIAGIFIGYFVLNNWAFFPAVNDTIEGVVNVFAQSSSTKTILFAFLIGGIITLIQASGGVKGFIYILTVKTKAIKSRKAVMLMAYIIGVCLFIESTITCLVSGTVSRPLADKYKISREKLSFICDSSSAPACSLIPLNAWGATLLALIAVQISTGIIGGNSVEILLHSVFYNFYSMVALIAVPFYIFTSKDFGPMRKAEIRALEEGKVIRDGAVPLTSSEATDIERIKGVKPNMLNMLLPIIVLVVMMPISLYITGDGNMFKGSGSTSVLWSMLASLCFTGIFYISQRIMGLHEFMGYIYKGCGAMVPVASILIFAFAIGTVSTKVGTGQYLASLVEGRIAGGFGPAIIFIFGAITAFSTGTSWGTFAIMMPISINMAVAMDANLYACIGAVISGGVMGDHCSPISDTTIVASMATASDHIDHVRTQLPYAVLNGLIAFVLFIIAGFYF